LSIGQRIDILVFDENWVQWPVVQDSFWQGYMRIIENADIVHDSIGALSVLLTLFDPGPQNFEVFACVLAM
jgi:hypothetical protein